MNVETHAKINMAALDMIEAASVAFYSRDAGDKAYHATRAEKSLEKLAAALGFDLTRRDCVMEAAE